MKRRHLGVACALLVAQGAGAAVPATSFTSRLSQWRRRLLRSHVALLVLGGLAIGVPIGLRARFLRPRPPPPWQR